jgi:CBS domain containing-hemolysin-like protein
MTLEFAALALLVLLSAFFSGLEIAIFSLGKAHLHSLVERKVRGAAVVARLKANPERLLVTILLGNNVVNIGAAAIATALSMRAFGDIGVGIATGVMTFLILVFGEITPKTFAYRWAERYSLLAARPLEIFSWIIFPLVWLLEKLTRGLTLLSGAESQPGIKHKSLLSSLARMGLEEGELSESEHRLVESAVRLDRVPADRVMTPRSDMIAIEAGKTLAEAIDALAEAPHSRYPVYREELDDIVGILHIRDLYEQLRRKGGSTPVAEIAAKPAFVPRTMVIGDLLRLFQRERSHMAIVIGEYAETAGLVTLEDVLEEMVGEIEDETDFVRKQIHRLGERRWLVDASLPMDDLQRAIGISLPNDQHNTINGLLLDAFQEIPRPGATIEAGGYTFIIRKADARRIILAELIAPRESETT